MDPLGSSQGTASHDEDLRRLATSRYFQILKQVQIRQLSMKKNTQDLKKNPLGYHVTNWKRKLAIEEEMCHSHQKTRIFITLFREIYAQSNRLLP